MYVHLYTLFPRSTPVRKKEKESTIAMEPKQAAKQTKNKKRNSSPIPPYHYRILENPPKKNKIKEKKKLITRTNIITNY